MPEPRDVTYPVPTDVNTALTVLETYGPAVTEALRQLDRATTVAWKAVSLVEVTDEEWQLVKHAIGSTGLGGGLPVGVRPRPARAACRHPPDGP